MAQAGESKGKIKALNQPLLDMACDTALVNQKGGRYNWLTDQTGGGFR
jgi:hypothetical protein